MKTIIALVSAIAIVVGVFFASTSPALAGVRQAFQPLEDVPSSGTDAGAASVSGSGGATDNATRGKVTAVVVQASSMEAHNVDLPGGGKWVTLFKDPPAMDLVKLSGQEFLIGAAQAPAGKYTQVRLNVTGVTVTADGREYAATVPGNQLKVTGNITIVEGKQTAVTLEFEASEAVVFSAEGKVTLKPVLELKADDPGQGKGNKGNVNRRTGENAENDDRDDEGGKHTQTGNQGGRGHGRKD